MVIMFSILYLLCIFIDVIISTNFSNTNFTQEEINLGIEFKNIFHGNKVKKYINVMNPIEISLLVRELSYVKHSYFEYDIGGSTIITCDYSMKSNNILKINGIDIYSYMIEKMQHDLCIYKKIEDGTANLMKIDLNFNLTEFKNVYLNYCEAMNNIKDKIDLVLINGRFQIACLITTFLTQPKARILFHNYYEMSNNNTTKLLEQISYVKERAYTYTRIVRNNDVTNEQLNEILCNLDFKNLDY